jgi:non-heme chloroperoxidase
VGSNPTRASKLQLTREPVFCRINRSYNFRNLTEILDWWARMLADACSLKTMVDLQRTFSEKDFRPDLRTISILTLLIHGDNDISAPIETTARKTLPLIRGAELKVYEGAAHGLPITHAERLNADLLEFAK